MKRSLPKFAARCTIKRPVGCPLLVDPAWTAVALRTVGVVRSRAFASDTQTKIAHATAAPIKRLVKNFTPQFIPHGVHRQALQATVSVNRQSATDPVQTLLSLNVMSAALRILAVDNEPSVTFSLRHIFNGPRYELSAVENGDAALARLDSGSEQYDVIIVDQKMPHMTGLELVGEMRKRGITSKIMVLSADVSPEVREAYERVDVHLVFPKPFNICDLRSAIDHLVA